MFGPREVVKESRKLKNYPIHGSGRMSNRIH
jgi:hypothetical protein